MGTVEQGHSIQPQLQPHWWEGMGQLLQERFWLVGQPPQWHPKGMAKTHGKTWELLWNSTISSAVTSLGLGAGCPGLSHHTLGIRRVTSSLGLSSKTHPKLYRNSLQSSVWLQKKAEVSHHNVRCTNLECLLMAATMRAVQPSLCLAFTSAPSSNNLERGEIWSGYEESTPSILELMRESRMFYCAGTCSRHSPEDSMCSWHTVLKDDQN